MKEFLKLIESEDFILFFEEIIKYARIGAKRRNAHEKYEKRMKKQRRSSQRSRVCS